MDDFDKKIKEKYKDWAKDKSIPPKVAETMLAHLISHKDDYIKKNGQEKFDSLVSMLKSFIDKKNIAASKSSN